MVSLRNQGYDNEYLVMVETNLDVDYLLPFFQRTAISKDVYSKLKMDDKVFIKTNENQDLSPVTKIKRNNDDLGSLRLITVCLASDFMKYSNLCDGGESPFYIKKIDKTRTPNTLPKTLSFSGLVKKNKNNLYRWNKNKLDNNIRHKLLDIYVENAGKIKVLKNSKSSITIYTTDKAKINDTKLEANTTYIIKFQLLDRSGTNKGEYFIHKSVIDKIPSKEDIMLDNIRQYVE